MPRRFVAFAAAAILGCGSVPMKLEDHPLAGRIWEPAAQRFLSAAEAEARVREADVALLGETHDNPHHHAIQLRLLRALVQGGRKPTLAMEQIDLEHQPSLEAALKPGATPESIATATRVAPGWKWPRYAPLVALALAEHLPIVATNLSRERAREVGAKGFAVLGAGEAERLALEAAWAAEKSTAMRRVLVAAHCGEDSPGIDRMIDMQRSRDALMADRILAARSPVVAIIGRGHARRDLGVPLYMARRDPSRRVLSLGIVEVEEAHASPSGYPEAAPGVHDLVWFTARAARKDPCG